MTNYKESHELARRLRRQVLTMVHKAKASHVGSCLSIVEILAFLYTHTLKYNTTAPQWNDRDRFILSKGHAAAVFYAVLAEKNFFPKEWLLDYCQNGSLLTGHISHYVPGVEVSTGSLGHGLPIGCGMSLAAKRDNHSYRTFVLLSDGELDEGSNWEAILFAAHHKLDNLVAIVDYNKIQSFGAVKDVLNLEPLADKWRAFGWNVQEIDGHDFQKLDTALAQISQTKEKPSVIIANTIKGKGVSFMEGKLEWHYKSPNDQQLNDALKELEANL